MFSPDRILTIDDATIHYKVLGNGEKNILFLHGFALSLHSWDLLIEKINISEYRCISIDINGFGFSRNTASDNYSIERQAALTLKVLEHLGISEVTLISHSYGGVIALYLTFLSISGEINLKIEKEVLIDTPAFTEAIPNFIRILQKNICSLFLFRLVPSNMIARYIVRTTFFDVPKALSLHLKRYRFFLKRKGSKKRMILMAKQILPLRMNELIHSYSKITFPVLIIWGENDQLIPLEYGIKLADQIQHSKISIIPNCGHVPHEECPSETFEEINHFLKSI